MSPPVILRHRAARERLELERAERRALALAQTAWEAQARAVRLRRLAWLGLGAVALLAVALVAA